MNNVKELDLIVKGLKENGFNIYISLPEESEFHRTYVITLENNSLATKIYRKSLSIHKRQLEVIFSDDDLKAKVLLDIIKDLLKSMRYKEGVVPDEN